jgi:hypothetical protein
MGPAARAEGKSGYFLIHGVDEVLVAQLVEKGSFVANFRPISHELYPDVVRADDVAPVALPKVPGLGMSFFASAEICFRPESVG